MSEERTKPKLVPDVYELQVFDVEDMGLQAQQEKNEKGQFVDKLDKNGNVKKSQTYRLTMLILDTKNPDYHDEPYMIRFLDVTVPGSKTLKFKLGDGTPVTTGLFSLLDGLGLEPDPDLHPSKVNVPAVKGMFARGPIMITDSGYIKLQNKFKGLMAIKNEEHRKANLLRRNEVIAA